jgi:hypothetical protein
MEWTELTIDLIDILFQLLRGILTHGLGIDPITRASRSLGSCCYNRGCQCRAAGQGVGLTGKK